MYYLFLLILTLLFSPITNVRTLIQSCLLFVIIDCVIRPITVWIIERFLAMPKAPQELAENFRNIVLAHRGGQHGNECASPALKGGVNTASNVNGVKAMIFPENSMAAFEWASNPQLCGGADGFELDVWLSKDGVPMVNHDPNIFRHFAGEGRINDMTVKQLQAIPYLATFHKLNTNEEITIDEKYIKTQRMPTLEEVLIFLEKKAPHMKCMIEVKEIANVSGMCRALKSLYDRYPWMYERTFVAAFNPLVLIGVRRLDTRIVTSFLFINDWSRSLIKNAKDMKVAVPAWLEYNYPLRWALDTTILALGQNRWGLNLLGANLSACEVKMLNENQIRKEKADGTITSVWVANQYLQKEWLLSLGVTVITDLQFSGGNSRNAPRPQIVF